MPTGRASTKPQGALEVAMLTIILRAMAEQGVTRDALARAAGMSPSQLTNVFKGSKTARFSEIAGMCEALGLRLSDVAEAAAREAG